MKEEFNKYCADVMDYSTWLEEPAVPSNTNIMVLSIVFRNDAGDTDKDLYNPYDDLNQMAEVVEKLFDDFSSNEVTLLAWIKTIGRITDRESLIKQAFRDFIISTMLEDRDER